MLGVRPEAATPPPSASSPSPTSQLSSSSFSSRSTTPVLSPIPSCVERSLLFHNMSAENKVRAIHRLEGVANRTGYREELEDLVRAMNIGPASIRTLFRNVEVCDLAVLAWIADRIAQYQMATIFYWRPVLRHYASASERTVWEVPLFVDGRVNPGAREIIRSAMLPPVGRNHDPVLTAGQIDRYLDDMRDLPPSEKMLLLVKPISDGRAAIAAAAEAFFQPTSDDQRTLDLLTYAYYTSPYLERPRAMDAVYSVAGSNLFNRVVFEGQNYKVFPSAGMIHALYRSIHNNRMVYRFCAGELTRENALRGICEIVLENPYHDCIQSAYLLPAPAGDRTSLGLLYRAHVIHSVPERDRSLFVELGDVIAEKYSDDDGQNNPFINRLVEHFYALECLEYLPHRHRASNIRNPADAFVASIVNFPFRALYQFCLSKILAVYANAALTDDDKKAEALRRVASYRRALISLSRFRVRYYNCIISHLKGRATALRTPFESAIIERLQEQLVLIL